jgi:hypothetical protein
VNTPPPGAPPGARIVRTMVPSSFIVAVPKLPRDGAVGAGPAVGADVADGAGEADGAAVGAALALAEVVWETVPEGLLQAAIESAMSAGKSKDRMGGS